MEIWKGLWERHSGIRAVERTRSENKTEVIPRRESRLK